MFNHLKLARGGNFPSIFQVDFERAVLKCIDCVEKNLLVQNWFRRVWSLQLVPPADGVQVFENLIKTTAPYKDDEEAIYEDPDRVEGFDENLSQYVTYVVSNLVGTPNAYAPHKKSRLPITFIGRKIKQNWFVLVLIIKS